MSSAFDASAVFSRHSRRTFLARSSAVLASGILSRTAAAARPLAKIVAVPARSTRAVGSFVPPVMDPAIMRMLARTAIDAAVHVGAQYADIRIGDQRQFFSEGFIRGSWLSLTYGYGLRVQVDGASAFVGGADPTPDRLAAAARSAVATAKGMAKIMGPTAPVIAVPVVTGEWNTPIEIDPFAVSPDDHLFVYAGYGRIEGPINERSRLCTGVDIGVRWTAETRVFASSDGSLATQRLARALPTLSARAFTGWPDPPGCILDLALVPPSSAGFEMLLGTRLHERIEQSMEEIATWMRYPVIDAEVGRKPVVFDGQSFGSVVGETIAPALSLARVLGEEQDGAGVSFLEPPEAILGEPLFSPQLNVSTMTGRTQFGCMQWDDEGVLARTCPLIERGAVVDYLTTRSDIRTLEQWYAKRNLPLRPQGTVWADDVSIPSRAISSAVAVGAAPDGPSLAELVKSLKDGVLVRSSTTVPDHQCSGGTIFPDVAFEVRNGNITRRLGNFRLEFSTRTLLKNVVAIGGASTAETKAHNLYGGTPVTSTSQAIDAPAAQIRDVNIVSNVRRMS